VSAEKTEEGKRLLRITELNEIAFTELIHSIDVSNKKGKIAFGIVKSCKASSIGKAIQKNINKQWKGGSSVPGERLYVDTCSIQGVSFGGASFGRWLLIIIWVIVGAISAGQSLNGKKELLTWLKS
jgi:hypothetical protein